MLVFTDPEDHKLMVSDMTQQRNDLRRDHHISEIRKLAQRHYGLRVMGIQRNVIRILRQQLEEVEVELKNVYSSQNAIKDYTSKDYMVYLLEMQDFYRKSVDKLKDQLKELDCNVRDSYLKLSVLKQHYAKKLRQRIGSMSKEKVIQMYEGRIERAHSEMGRLTAKNRDCRDGIRHTFIVRGNFFKIYQTFKDRNERDKRIISHHLEKAVSAYRSREDFLYKTGILKERFAVDMQKVVANSILLHRIKERDVKTEEFEDVKAQERTDCRASQIEEQVRKGVTGLEPEVDGAKAMHSKVMDASGVSSLEDVRERFESAENLNFGFFCYINTLDEEMDIVNGQLKGLRKEIDTLEKNLSVEQRNSRRKMTAKKAKVEELDLEVQAAEDERQKIENELGRTKDAIQQLLPDVRPDVTAAEKFLEELLTSLESKVSEHLMLIEYINYLEVEDEEPEKRKEVDSEADLESVASVESFEVVVDGAPKALSDSQKLAMKDLAECPVFMSLDELRLAASSALEDASNEDNVGSPE